MSEFSTNPAQPGGTEEPPSNTPPPPQQRKRGLSALFSRGGDNTTDRNNDASSEASHGVEGGADGESKAKNMLAASRKMLLGRLKVASAGVKVFQENMKENLHVPKPSLGIFFVLGFVFYVAFTVVLAVSALSERNISASRIAYLSLHNALDSTGYRKLDRTSEIPVFLASLAYSRIAPEGNMDTPSNLFAGGVLVTQQQTVPAPCDTLPDAFDTASQLVSLNCLSDVADDTMQRSAVPSEKFPGQSYEYIKNQKVCFGSFCASATQSLVRSSKIFYGTEGYELMLYNQTWWLDEKTPIVSTNATTGRRPNVAIDRTKFPLNDTQEGMVELFNDFLDENTRVVTVEFSILNTVESLLTTSYLVLEIPISGGVFPTLLVRSYSLKAFDIYMETYLLLYAVLSILVMTGTFLRNLIGGNKDCLVCQEAKKKQILIFNCVKCNCPCELTTSVIACSQCTTPIPALEHKCWRRVALEVWNWQLFIMMSLLIIAKGIMFLGQPILKEMVQEVFTIMNVGAVPVRNRFESAVTLYRWYEDLIAVCVVLSYLKVFRYSCRGRVNSRFVRVFGFGLPPLIAFSVNFVITFIGFVLAFHLIQGTQAQGYSTIAGSATLSFRSLMGVQDQPEVGPVGLLFLLIFITFFLICASMMFNVFPSVLSVAYKRAINTPYYDTEVLSLWIILKPVLRKMKIIEDPEEKRKKLQLLQAATQARKRALSEAKANAAKKQQQEEEDKKQEELEKSREEQLDDLQLDDSVGTGMETSMSRNALDIALAQEMEEEHNLQQKKGAKINDSFAKNLRKQRERSESMQLKVSHDEQQELDELNALNQMSTEEGRLTADKAKQTERVSKLNQRTKDMRKAIEAMFYGVDDQVGQLAEQIDYLTELMPSLILDATHPGNKQNQKRGGGREVEASPSYAEFMPPEDHHLPYHHAANEQHFQLAELKALEKELEVELRKYDENDDGGDLQQSLLSGGGTTSSPNRSVGKKRPPASAVRVSPPRSRPRHKQLPDGSHYVDSDVDSEEELILIGKSKNNRR